MQTSSSSSSGAQAAGALLPALCMLIFALVMVALILYIWSQIFKKAGYSPWMALLMIVPIANLVWLIVFAFSKWPILQELEMYRAGAGRMTGGFPVMPPKPGQPPAPPMR